MINVLVQNFKKKLSYLEIHDVVNQIFLIFISFISLINYKSIPQWNIIILVNIILAIIIIQVVSLYESQTELRKKHPNLIRFLRYWYPMFMILFCFKTIYYIMMGLTPVIHDDLLIKIDFLIFGFNPTMVLKSISHPLITEFLQIIYALFYMMPVIFALELFLWHRYQELKFVTLVILFGFYLSFIGYLVLPAIGPRFILHDFYNLNNDLPGLWFTNFLRDLVNLGESIPKNTQNVELFAQRDAFPSGHTIIILLIVYLSRKIKSNSFYFYFPYSILMIFATVYLRYHYVVDLIGGLVFAILTILISNKLFSIKWKKETVSEVS